MKKLALAVALIGLTTVATPSQAGLLSLSGGTAFFASGAGSSGFGTSHGSEGSHVNGSASVLTQIGADAKGNDDSKYESYKEQAAELHAKNDMSMSSHSNDYSRNRDDQSSHSARTERSRNVSGNIQRDTELSGNTRTDKDSGTSLNIGSGVKLKAYGEYNK